MARLVEKETKVLLLIYVDKVEAVVIVEVDAVLLVEQVLEVDELLVVVVVCRPCLAAR